MGGRGRLREPSRVEMHGLNRRWGPLENPGARQHRGEGDPGVGLEKSLIPCRLEKPRRDEHR